MSADDNTVCANLCYVANNKIGKLFDHIPAPSLFADPSHWDKIMCEDVFKLVLAKYIGYYVYKNRELIIV